VIYNAFRFRIFVRLHNSWWLTSIRFVLLKFVAFPRKSVKNYPNCMIFLCSITLSSLKFTINTSNSIQTTRKRLHVMAQLRYRETAKGLITGLHRESPTYIHPHAHAHTHTYINIYIHVFLIISSYVHLLVFRNFWSDKPKFPMRSDTSIIACKA